MNRTWVTKGVVAMLLAVAAVAVAVPKDVREQTEASMLLTGKISINADGRVAGYEILQADKVPDYVLSNLAEWVPAWRFKPVLVGGKAVPARATMNVRILARPSGDDKLDVSTTGTRFGLDGRPTPVNLPLQQMTPQRPPKAVVSTGWQVKYSLGHTVRE